MATDGDTLQNDDGGQILDPNLDVDVDEYVRRRRLKSMNETRDMVYKILPKARLEQMAGNMSGQHRAALYTEAVQAYLDQVENTILKLDNAKEILTQEEIGSWQIMPDHGGGAELLALDGLENVEIDPETYEATAYGLRSIMESGAEYSIRWRVERDNHLRANEISQEVSHHSFPERVARRGFRLAIRFLDDAGMNYQPHTDNEVYEGKYEDLVDGEIQT